MEDLYIEFKNYSKDVIKTVCALLNSKSGKISIHFDKKMYFDFMYYNGQKQERFGIEDSYKNRLLYDLESKLWAFLKYGDFWIKEEPFVREFIMQVINKNIEVYPDYDDNNNKILVVEVQELLKHTLSDLMHEIGGMTGISDVFFCIKKEARNMTNKIDEKNYSKNEKEFVYEFYFRIGEATIKTDSSHLLYYYNNREYDIPIYKDYEPSEYKKKKKFSETRKKNRIVFEAIGNLPYGNNLYKYMDLESALLCLEKRIQNGIIVKNPNIRFVEPTSWDDQYEGRFYNACYKTDDGKGNLIDVDPAVTPFLYACCFSSKRENEAAWVLYSHNRTGLASRCVEFTLNRMKLREELVINQENCSLYIGSVKYLNKEAIDSIHQQTIGKDGHPNKDYDKYFNPFSKECYLNLLLLKRPAFEHEKEVRIFIVPNDEIRNPKARRREDGKFPPGVKPNSRYVNIDWVEVIDEVRIDKNCTDFEVSLLQNSLDELVKAKKQKDNLGNEEYEEMLKKFKLKKFDPYKDDSLAQGPITIVTN